MAVGDRLTMFECEEDRERVRICKHDFVVPIAFPDADKTVRPKPNGVVEMEESSANVIERRMALGARREIRRVCGVKRD